MLAHQSIYRMRTPASTSWFYTSALCRLEKPSLNMFFSGEIVLCKLRKSATVGAAVLEIKHIYERWKVSNPSCLARYTSKGQLHEKLLHALPTEGFQFA